MMENKDAILILSEMMCDYASRLVYGPESEEYRESLQDHLLAIKMGMRALEIEGELKRKAVSVKIENTYWAKCGGCEHYFRMFMMAEKKAKCCPNCGRRLEWDEQGRDPEEDLHHHPQER